MARLMKFADCGEHLLKITAQPVRVFKFVSGLAADLQSPPDLPDKPSIAVWAFQNMSGDAEQDYFADSVVEDIITSLSRFSGLFVIARNSSFSYKGSRIDIKHIGRELGVRYV